ncbi:DUF167 domain-containing protein [Terriglobus albidus]|uniref:DUF167 domain-containing protein n=1 Tax=Terriglobus albidus TaxID=1592106 RepID=UPI0021E00B78|nr:DUF167 domain-containing protein [Terriglobus albidus]
MSLRLQQSGEDCLLPVRLHPGARRTAITGEHDGALKIALTAPPVEGKANVALLRYLAEILGLSQSRVILKSGQTSRSKMILITCIRAEEVAAKLDPATYT